jgi:hypothetical protein
MKKFYLLAPGLSLFFILTGCSKDFLKRYEERIEGTWTLVDVDRNGWSGSTSGLPFRDGTFIFSDNGNLEYISTSGDSYQGSWNMRKRWMPGNCINGDCNDRYVRSLQIHAINFTTQDLITEYFDDIVFTGTNRFKALIYTGTSTYVYRFRR